MHRPIHKIWQDLDANEKANLKAGLLIICLIGFLSIFIFPLIVPSTSWPFRNYTSTGQIGDTINGIAGPFIALLAAVMTFLAFYIQFKANEAQREQFKTQAKDVAIERFESRFFEIIRIHRENVKIINSRDQTSRNDLFITMFFELKFIYNYAKKVRTHIEGKSSRLGNPYR